MGVFNLLTIIILIVFFPLNYTTNIKKKKVWPYENVIKNHYVSFPAINTLRKTIQLRNQHEKPQNNETNSKHTVW